MFDKTMTLNQKVQTMEREVGHLPMLCMESDCLHRAFEFVKGYHCKEEIPYVKRIGDKIHILSLCTYKIEEYFKK